MEDNSQQTVFRKKTLERISSPEQLTDYLRVATPGIWVLLVSVILILAGFFAWSYVGTLETCADVKVTVVNQAAQIVPSGGEKLTAGMPLYIHFQEYTIASTNTDEYGRVTGRATVDLPDGVYDGRAAVERTRPIDYLLTSR